jgi:hypothetical protein
MALVQFANRENVHCVSMVSLGGAKLANPLTTKASHFSLGSASLFKYLAEMDENANGLCLFFVYYRRRAP